MIPPSIPIFTAIPFVSLFESRPRQDKEEGEGRREERGREEERGEGKRGRGRREIERELRGRLTSLLANNFFEANTSHGEFDKKKILSATNIAKDD